MYSTAAVGYDMSYGTCCDQFTVTMFSSFLGQGWIDMYSSSRIRHTVHVVLSLLLLVRNDFFLWVFKISRQDAVVYDMFCTKKTILHSSGYVGYLFIAVYNKRPRQEETRIPCVCLSLLLRGIVLSSSILGPYLVRSAVLNYDMRVCKYFFLFLLPFC